MENECKRQLLEEIDDAIEAVASRKEAARVKCLSRYNPERVAQILYLYSQGVSQSQMIRRYGLNRNAIRLTLVDYADRLEDWRSLGGKLAARSFLSLSSLQEDLVEKLQELMEGEEFRPTFRDLRDLSFALEQAWRMSVAARENAPTVARPERVVTQADYDETARKAKSRLAELRAE